MPKKEMTLDTREMHNKRNNENKIAVTHIDRIQDYVSIGQSHRPSIYDKTN